MAEEAKWYVIHTYSGYENKVATNIEKVVENRGLHDLIPEVKVPTETVVEIKDDKTKEVERKLFPGYVMVKMVMNEDTRYIVRNILGCTGFVGPGSRPVPLTDEEVARMGVESKVVEVNFAVGDTVNVIDGNMVGFSGKVAELDVDNNVVKVIISMFGRETPVEFQLNQLELAKSED